MADFKFNNVQTIRFIILARKGMTIYSPYGISSNDSLEGLGLNENNLNICVLCVSQSVLTIYIRTCVSILFYKNIETSVSFS